MLDFFQEEDFQPGYSLTKKIIYGSMAVGAAIVMVGVFLYIQGADRIGGTAFLLGLMIGVVPFGILSFLRNRAVRQMEDQFPSFLKDLAESKRGGMTIMKAFESAKETDYGRLNSEIEKIHYELTWGIPFPEVMERFSKRMKDSAVIQESTSIIIQSFESGGEITKTIESVGDDATKLKEVIQEKDAKLRQQLVIMYVIYFLFIGITIGIYTMLAQLLGLGSPDPGALSGVKEVLSQSGSGGGGGSGPTNYCSGSIAAAQPFCSTAKIFGFVPANVTSDLASEYANQYSYGRMAYYKSLLFTMLMIQGACTAAVAGQVSEGSPSAGVKHALIMLPLAFIAFMVAVASAGVP
ncbi:type II secretion system F family protein [Candidatus Nanohalovita haloferacivicina]|uniref:type II secretion system F family protein n=1 Tax=Candidatus Nanohalovita haloferacivicina TaxID=2978046 RepID=UPI00325FB686|nr:Archaeal flagellar protein FlaJ [Candidatus Nanohalobia archaeon BNXNv]